MSLSVSARAFLQSIMPAPVLSRSCLTNLALTATLGLSCLASASAFSAFESSSFFASASFFIAIVCSSTSLARSPCFFSMPSPRLNLVKRRIFMFSPILEIASTNAWLTFLVGSMMYGCSRRAFSFTSFATRPAVIWSRMFSGLVLRSSICFITSVSFLTYSGSASSTFTYSTPGLAATCIARDSASSLNCSPRDTKSVSQLTSMRTPSLDPAWMYDTIAPSAATREAFLAAPAMPLARRYSSAFSKFPSDSERAFLHCIMPTPVLSRNCLTTLADISPKTRTSRPMSRKRMRDTPYASLGMGRCCTGIILCVAIVGAARLVLAAWILDTAKAMKTTPMQTLSKRETR
mmetsp:Transcript_16780/g.26629  ORF Transcript_16780/g.26629 Transcript_16780/m.26629 type:complete len:348 (-) Transcript_16780:65-1108(-)